MNLFKRNIAIIFTALAFIASPLSAFASTTFSYSSPNVTITGWQSETCTPPNVVYYVVNSDTSQGTPVPEGTNIVLGDLTDNSEPDPFTFDAVGNGAEPSYISVACIDPNTGDVEAYKTAPYHITAPAPTHTPNPPLVSSLDRTAVASVSAGIANTYMKSWVTVLLAIGGILVTGLFIMWVLKKVTQSTGAAPTASGSPFGKGWAEDAEGHRGIMSNGKFFRYSEDAGGRSGLVRNNRFYYVRENAGGRPGYLKRSGNHKWMPI